MLMPRYADARADDADIDALPWAGGQPWPIMLRGACARYRCFWRYAHTRAMMLPLMRMPLADARRLRRARDVFVAYMRHVHSRCHHDQRRQPRFAAHSSPSFDALPA